MRKVEPAEAHRIMREGVIMLDVREEHEWDAGHAPGAVHIALSALDPTIVPAGQTLLAVCRSGRRSAEACAKLSAAGRDAINVTGGMEAWRDAELPVVTASGATGRIV